MGKGLDDAFKKVTMPAGVTVVLRKHIISPGHSINPKVHPSNQTPTARDATHRG